MQMLRHRARSAIAPRPVTRAPRPSAAQRDVCVRRGSPRVWCAVGAGRHTARFFFSPLFLLSSQTRLAKYYIPLDDADKRTLEYDVHRCTSGRDPGFAAVADYKGAKLIFRRYAGLYFTLGADAADNELVLMEAIHLFVEVKGREVEGRFFFSLSDWRRECESVGANPPFFSFPPSDPGPLLWQRVRAGPGVQLSQGEEEEGDGESEKRAAHKNTTHLPPFSHAHKVYLILDEFILAGEIQETSKRVILERLAELDRIDT